jgi:hypothetical protein
MNITLLLHRRRLLPGMFQFRFNFLARWPLTHPATIFAYQIFVFDESFSFRLFDEFVAITTMIFRFEEAFFNSHHFVSESQKNKSQMKNRAFNLTFYFELT